MTTPQDPFGPQGEDEATRPEALMRRAGVLESAPEPQVWDRICRELELELDAPGPQAQTPAGSSTSRPARWPLLAAAAVGALLTWAGTALLGDGADETGQLVAAQVSASGSLAALPDSGTQVQGEAEVVDVDGQQRLRVELDEVPDAEGGYLEVWLLRPDVSGMITLGVLTDQVSEFDLPAGMDLDDYPVVDISREAMDGDPSHGGNSLVRGQLEGPAAWDLHRDREREQHS